MKILSIFVCLYSLTVFSFFEKDHVNDIKVDVIYRYGQTYFGHISYKITKDKKTSYYSYPSGNDERFDREYYGNHVEICTIYINKEKYQNFLKWYKKSIYSKFDKGNSIYTYCGHYHIINFNCAHFVEYSLRTMGIPLERFFTWKPRTPAYVFKKLKNYLKDIECCNFYHKRKVSMQVVRKKELSKKEYFELKKTRNQFFALFAYFFPNFDECMYFYGS